MNEANIYGLKQGEDLRVHERYVVIHSPKNHDYKVLNFNGVLLGHCTEEEWKSYTEPACIQLQDCILVKKDHKMRFLTYDGEVICDAVKHYRLTCNEHENYNRSFQYDFNDYVTIVTETGEAAIYSKFGECILSPKDCSCYIQIQMESNIAYLTLKNKLIRVYDLENRSFIGETFTKKENYYPHVILHNGETHYLFNALKKELTEIDACYIKQEQFKYHIVWSIYAYKNGKCGLWLKLKENTIFQALPIKYTKILVDEQFIYAKENEKVEKFSLDEVIVKNTKHNSGDIVTSNKKAQINIFGITLYKGERLYLQKKCFFVSKSKNDEHVANYYNLEGKYIGKSYAETVIDREVTWSYEFGDVLALSEFRDKWKIYDYNGQRITEKEYDNGYVIEEANCMIFWCKNREDLMQSEVLILKKILLRLDGFKAIEFSCDSFFIATDYFDKSWVFDYEGTPIFQERFETIDKEILPLIIQNEDNGNGYTIYDCVNKTKQHLEVDDIIYVRGTIFPTPYYIGVLHGKKGVFVYKEDTGFKKVVPIEYQNIEEIYFNGYDWLAQTSEKDDIYNSNGEIISSTHK